MDELRIWSLNSKFVIRPRLNTGHRSCQGPTCTLTNNSGFEDGCCLACCDRTAAAAVAAAMRTVANSILMNFCADAPEKHSPKPLVQFFARELAIRVRSQKKISRLAHTSSPNCHHGTKLLLDSASTITTATTVSIPSILSVVTPAAEALAIAAFLCVHSCCLPA